MVASHTKFLTVPKVMGEAEIAKTRCTIIFIFFHKLGVRSHAEHNANFDRAVLSHAMFIVMSTAPAVTR